MGGCVRIHCMNKRPALVWVISVFLFLAAAWTLFSFYLVFSGVVPLDAASQAYFASIGFFDWLVTGAIFALNLSAAISLLMLRKIAVNLFIGAFAINILSTVVTAFRTNWTEALGGSGLFGVLIGWGIALAIIFYARDLAKKGILT